MAIGLEDPPTGEHTESPDNLPSRGEQLRAAYTLLSLHGRQPITELQHALQTTVTMTGCELAVLRHMNGNPEVLLIKQPDVNERYAGMYLLPCSLRHGFETTDDVLSRIIVSDLNGLDITVPIYLRDNLFRLKDCQERTMLHVAFLRGEAHVHDEDRSSGEWFSLDGLPIELADHHRLLIWQVRDWLEQQNALLVMP